MKNAIDFLYAEWHDKAAGFVAMLDQVVAWSQAMKDVRLGREAARGAETPPALATAS